MKTFIYNIKYLPNKCPIPKLLILFIFYLYIDINKNYLFNKILNFFYLYLDVIKN